MKNKGFTLSEVLVTLTVIGIIAALLIPGLIRNYEEYITVLKVRKTYHSLTQVFKRWQMDEECVFSIGDCLQRSKASGGSFNCNILKEFAGKDLKIIDMYTNKDRSEAGSLWGQIPWLPTDSYGLNGTRAKYVWQGVNQAEVNIKDKESGNPNSCYYLLNDGTTIMAHLPDDNGRSGFLFFDVNGKRPPNRVGKDQFPMGIGAYTETSAKKWGWDSDKEVLVPLVGRDTFKPLKMQNTVNPFYNEDQWLRSNGSLGMCQYRNGSADSGQGDGDGECNPIACNNRQTPLSNAENPNTCSPTAYVLATGKLPDFKAMGYPEKP